jgi:hypothetical protein
VKTFSEVQSFKRQLLLAEKGLMDHAKATAGAAHDMRTNLHAMRTSRSQLRLPIRRSTAHG